MTVIIVESPTKARTFNRIFKQKKMDSQYQVIATLGHFRDLPPTKMGISFDKQFEPQYEIMSGKEKVYNQLKDLLEEDEDIIFATDPDREGESISYHAAYALGLVDERWPEFSFPKGSLKRIIFHEITPKALEEALQNPTTLRIDLVKAQQARRILDRIVGYDLSPLLWKKTGKNWLSAGRVQTVALRLVVEREKEIERFKTEDYYQLFGHFKLKKTDIKAKLVSKNDEEYEIKQKIQLFDGEYQYTKTSITKDTIEFLKKDVESDVYSVKEIKDEVQKRYPPPPLTTSLLQQTAYQKLRYPSKLTMRIAQQLYEKGLITYHRTDSFNLSANFVFRAKDYITEKFGKDYALEKPRGFQTKSKMAQEAHEAIRPTRLEQDNKKIEKLSENQAKLYKVIFERAVACQMKEAEIKQYQIKIEGKKGYQFQAEFKNVLFDGFFKLLQPAFAERHGFVPHFKEGDSADVISLEEENQTKPPNRYNEASLIKTLEQKGIGRPSTYSSIISLIIDKHYVDRESGQLMPTGVGNGISDYLARSFPDIFTIDFTANMEDSLDNIAEGNVKMIKLLKDFYDPFITQVKKKEEEKEKVDIDEKVSETCDECGGQLVIKYSRFGKFLACSNYPDCKFTKTIPKFVQGAVCPKCQGRIVSRQAKSGKRFFGCENYPNCEYVAWSLWQARNPKKYAEQMAQKKAEAAVRKEAKKSAKASKVPKSSKTSKTTTSSTTKTVRKKTTTRNAKGATKNKSSNK